MHNRCEHMYNLLKNTAGSNDLGRLQKYFSGADHKNFAGKGTIDIMVFDTTSRTAYRTRRYLK